MPPPALGRELACAIFQNIGATIDPQPRDHDADIIPAIPVFGIGEEVFHEAARDGRPFGIVTVTPDEELTESFRQKAVALGYEAQYRGVRVTPGDPTELVQDPDRLDAALTDAVRQSVTEDGAEAVIMGGGPLSASAIRLQPQFEQPLVIAVTAAARAVVKQIADPD